MNTGNGGGTAAPAQAGPGAGRDVDVLGTAPGAGRELPPDLARPYFLGIGGIGMSGLAKVLVARGARVGGSDAKDSLLLSALRGIGCDIHIGHDPAHLGDPSCVVVSSAIRADNPERLAAEERAIPVLHRSQVLARLMAGRRAVTVAGTHGKTTTTSMLSVAFSSLGLDPSYAIGADLNEPGSNAHHGSGELFVAEADESDRSFLRYAPEVAIVLNVEHDHHDNYASPEEVLVAFEQFAGRVLPGGTLVLSADDAGAGALAGRVRASRPGLRLVTYGESADADVRITGIEPTGLTSDATVLLDADPVALHVPVPGRHNAHNATAALAAGVALGVPVADLVRGLGAYQGVRRRFQVKGIAAGVTVVDSYAHHPTEMAADLATARQTVGGGRVVAVFQPHLFSRTRALGDAMGAALAAADIAVVLDIYRAREDPVPGVTSDLVAHAALRHGGLVRTIHTWAAVPEIVAAMARPGDLVLTMGAGDVTMLGPEILAALP